MTNPVPYHSYFTARSSLLSDIEELFASRSFTHYASQLLQKGLYDEQDLESAVQKAITACVVAGLPATRHFKIIYICSEEIKKDWLVSDLAIKLIILNADVSNPLVARLQIEIISNNSASNRINLKTV
jgi:hypothetical protein